MSILLVGCLIGLVVAGASAQTLLTFTATDVQQFYQSVNNSDFSAIGSLYAQDAKMLPNNHAIIEGRSAIESYFKGLLTPDLNFKIYVKGVTNGAVLVVAHGTFERWLKSKKTSTDKFMTVFRPQSGKLQIIYNMWNSDLPCSGN